jgi:hypothetical protein
VREHAVQLAPQLLVVCRFRFDEGGLTAWREIARRDEERLQPVPPLGCEMPHAVPLPQQA